MPVTDPRLGTELAGHRIEALIGRGGMGVVYLAEHLRLGRKVALKLLTEDLAEDERFRERFVRESRLAAGLDHPNIVTVFDAGEAEGLLYISMRYVRGSDLKQLLREEGSLDPPRALSIVTQLGSALDFAHAEGLVHRDVKPANVLLAAGGDHGGNDRVFLSDFGLTKRMHSGGGLTRSGQFVGTIDYVAPEQVSGRRVDGRGDVYSLGCLLFHCLAGDVPFRRESEVAVMFAHLREPPPLLSDVRPDLPPELDDVIGRAMAKRPEDRYQTSAELVSALRGPLGVSQPSAERGEPTAKGVAEAPPTDGSRVARGAVVAGPRPKQRSPRRRILLWAGVPVVAGGLAIAAFLLLSQSGGTSPADRGVSTTPAPTTETTPTNEPSATPAVVEPLFVWTPVPSDPGVFGGPGRQAINRAVKGGPGLIAVGFETLEDVDGAIWTSSDEGATWERVLDVERATDRGIQMIGGVAAQGPSRLVAVGVDGSGGDLDAAAWASKDGIVWHRSGGDSPALDRPGDQYIRRVATVGELYVAVGYSETRGDRDAAVWTYNGTTWRWVPSPSFRGKEDQEMRAVAEFGSEIVAVGYSGPEGARDGAVWVFQEGNWSQVHDPSLGGLGDQH